MVSPLLTEVEGSNLVPKLRVRILSKKRGVFVCLNYQKKTVAGAFIFVLQYISSVVTELDG